MKAARGYYSLSQYCPDAGRAEAANVGVLLFCPDLGFLEARLSSSNDRVRRFFHGTTLDLARLDADKRAIQTRFRVDRERFRNLEDLERFIRTRANAMLLTPARPMKVAAPEAALDELFDELVGGRRARSPKRPVLPELDRAMRSPSLAGRIQYDQRVTVPILGTPLRVPYAYRNGELRLIKPHAFSEDEGKAMGQAARLAVDGDLLQRHPDPHDGKRRLVVVSTRARGETGPVERIDGLFREYQVAFVTRDRLGQLTAEIEKRAC